MSDRNNGICSVSTVTPNRKKHGKIFLLSFTQGIETLEIQGTKVKQYYPSPDLRMMSDIDIIIQKEHIPTAENVLKELGYKTACQGDFEVDGHKKGIHIEIHTDFFPENHRFCKIINEPFRYVTVNDDCTATVSDTVFYAYHLLYCLKHHQGKGIGLRRLLDLYFLAPKMAETADMEYINELLWYNISIAVSRYHDKICGYAYFCYNKAVMD